MLHGECDAVADVTPKSRVLPMLRAAGNNVAAITAMSALGRMHMKCELFIMRRSTQSTPFSP